MSICLLPNNFSYVFRVLDVLMHVLTMSSFWVLVRMHFSSLPLKHYQGVLLLCSLLFSVVSGS